MNTIARFIVRFIVRILANAAGILLAAYLVPGIIFGGNWVDLAITGFILALANSIVKPILKFITGPLIVLTLGLFMIIINIIILWLADLLIPELTISGLWAYVWGVLILAILNALTHVVTKKKS